MIFRSSISATTITCNEKRLVVRSVMTTIYDPEDGKCERIVLDVAECWCFARNIHRQHHVQLVHVAVQLSVYDCMIVMEMTTLVGRDLNH